MFKKISLLLSLLFVFFSSPVVADNSYVDGYKTTSTILSTTVSINKPTGVYITNISTTGNNNISLDVFWEAPDLNDPVEDYIVSISRDSSFTEVVESTVVSDPDVQLSINIESTVLPDEMYYVNVTAKKGITTVPSDTSTFVSSGTDNTVGIKFPMQFRVYDFYATTNPQTFLLWLTWGPVPDNNTATFYLGQIVDNDLAPTNPDYVVFEQSVDIDAQFFYNYVVSPKFQYDHSYRYILTGSDGTSQKTREFWFRSPPNPSI
ncbi:MAG: hypothetical protein GY804_08825 [Alphaproteobacteria bacterium]|nr:hypothetical protein [Alphaproteobacteria bacterium]